MKAWALVLYAAVFAAPAAAADRIQEIKDDIAAKGGTADLYVELGNACYDVADYKPAADAFRMAVGYAPSDGYIHYRLAEALFANGDLREAIVSYRTALACEPPPVRANYQIGQAYLALGDNAAAAAAFTAYVETAPADFNGLWFLGQAYERQGRYAEALEQYELIRDYATGPFAAAGEIGTFGTVEDLKKHIKKVAKKVK